jgi:hypothetical protein
MRIHHRRGTALFITLLVVAGFIALAVAASDRLSGMKKLTGVELGKQRAAAAAEAVAAMIESRLMDAAADYTKLLVPLDHDPGTGDKPWWGLRGCVYKDTTGKMRGPGFDPDSEGLWLNGCLVRWMVEPVRVYNKAWSGTPGSDSEFVVNPPRDPSTVNAWEADAKLGPDGQPAPGTHNKNVSDFYHFRIVAQAYALADHNDTLAEPWSEAGRHVAAAQSLRVLQVQSLQLFKYALFYAADTPVGDLDLQTGGTIWVQKGAVHSNGAIYIRGGESTGFNQKNWHVMASGDWGVDAPSAGQSIFLGEKDHPITITGVAGVFRMNKTANHLAALANLKYAGAGGTPVLFDPARPMDVPTDRARFLSDDAPPGRSGANPLDLNGDWKDSNRHRFNGENFTRDNDSRSPQEFVKAFKNYARDANNGGLRVATLQNIPELGGRPFEPQAIIYTTTGSPAPLHADAGLTTFSRYTKRNGLSLSPLYYASDPTAAVGATARPVGTRPYGRTTLVNTTNTAGKAVLAEEMRLWWDEGFKVRDVLGPSEEVALRDQIPQHATGAGYDAGNGPYVLGSSTFNAVDVDRERFAAYKPDGTLETRAGEPGTISFPGVPFTLPDGTVWNPKFFGTGFSPREVKGYYLEAALFGDLPVSGTLSKQQQFYRTATTTNAPIDIAKTGLVIRERRWQQVPAGSGAVPASEYYWPGAALSATPIAGGVIPRPILDPAAATWEQQKIDYVQYLCSQYVVLFCGRNITAPFFGQILAQSDPRDFIVTEDEFVDPRESGYMWGLYGANGDISGRHNEAYTDDFYQYEFFPPAPPQPATWSGGGTVGRDYRQNVLTIHMRAFQLWLRDTPMKDLGYHAATDFARDHFTGVVYCHRTRRSDTMHPLLTPELDWPGSPRVLNNVEADPSRLVSQTHFRAYWFTEVAGAGLTLPAGYPPVNFPWNWREPSGPLEATRCATRLKGQIDDSAGANVEATDPTYYRVFWDHTTPTSTSDPLGTSAFTYITPQRLYVWGNFCYRVNSITSESAGRAEIDANINSITPCAVFADNFTMLSTRWRDENSQSLPTGAGGYPSQMAGSTCYFTSMVINNSPNSAWNCGSFGSAGQEGTFRMIENWGYGATHVWWSGSQVVMNMGRYHHSGHNFLPKNRSDGRTQAPAHMGVGAFHTSTNHYVFNTNLFKREGRPPLSPSGVSATRVVNQVTAFGD